MVNATSTNAVIHSLRAGFILLLTSTGYMFACLHSETLAFLLLGRVPYPKGECLIGVRGSSDGPLIPLQFGSLHVAEIHRQISVEKADSSVLTNKFAIGQTICV